MAQATIYKSYKNNDLPPELPLSVSQQMELFLLLFGKLTLFTKVKSEYYLKQVRNHSIHNQGSLYGRIVWLIVLN